MTALLPLPIVLPLLAAGVLLALGRHRRIQAVVAVSLLGAVLAIAVALLVAALDGPVVLDVGNWAAPVGITLVADKLSTIMLVTSVTVTLIVLIYSIFQGVADGESGAPTSVYYPAFMVLSAGVSDAFLTGDLFNMYVGFEILLVASFVLLTMGGTVGRMRSGSVYVIVSMVSSTIFLTALGLVYAATGTVNLADLAVKLPQIDPGVNLAIEIMLLTAFGLKAAIFPLSAWLPDSYPTASGPVTAVFAGLLTKVGVYAIIRVETLLFPAGRLDEALAVIAILTMLVGIAGAMAQDNVKRLLSFTLVSHIGYLIWGVAISTEAGLSSTIFYAVHHIVVQTALFLVAGLIGWVAGTTSLTRLGSIMKAAPAVAVLYFIPALSLGGIPPLSGFLGKIGLLEASAARGTWWDWALIAAGLVTSLLTLYAMIRVWNMAFWQEAPAQLPAARYPRGMVSVAGVLVALVLAITVFAAPLRGLTDRAAAELNARTPYITAVLPEGGRGNGISPREADLPDEWHAPDEGRTSGENRTPDEGRTPGADPEATASATAGDEVTTDAAPGAGATAEVTSGAPQGVLTPGKGRMLAGNGATAPVATRTSASTQVEDVFTVREMAASSTTGATPARFVLAGTITSGGIDE